MKDKIIEKRGKKYLGSRYNDGNWLFCFAWIIMVVICIATVMLWIESPVDDQESYYLKIDDAGENDLGYYAVGDLYRLESFKNGDMNPTGEEGIIVSISEFVYRQIEEGNLISLAKDEDGNYRYGGDVYSSPSSTSLPRVSYQLMDDSNRGIEWIYALILGMLLLILFTCFCILDNRLSSVIIMIDDFNLYYKESRWYGKYIYGRARVNGSDDYEIIRIKDAWMFLNLGVNNGDSMFKEGNCFYTFGSEFRRIKNINDHIEKLMDTEAN